MQPLGPVVGGQDPGVELKTVQSHILQRLSHAVISLAGVTLLIFILTRLTGSPLGALLDHSASATDVAALSRQLGLDQPAPLQYWMFLSRLAHGDLGTSFTYRLPVSQLIADRVPATLQLAAASLIVSLVISIPMGVYAAAHRNSAFDIFARSVATVGQATPTFWLGIVLTWLFAVQLEILPAARQGGFGNMIMPVITLSVGNIAGIVRLLRAGMLEALTSDWMMTARMKGLSEGTILWSHCLRNAAVSTLTYTGLVTANLLTGSVVTETVFAWSGVGRLAADSIGARDYPTVQGVVLFLAAVFIVVNLVVDVCHAALDPRVRLS
jgi:peptide/nickel transport system permease protein